MMFSHRKSLMRLLQLAQWKKLIVIYAASNP